LLSFFFSFIINLSDHSIISLKSKLILFFYTLGCFFHFCFLFSIRPPSTDCSASMEWGGTRRDSAERSAAGSR